MAKDLTRDYERNKKIYDEYMNNENLSMEQLGLKYNISRQCVHSIISRFNEYRDYTAFKEVYDLVEGNTNLMSRLFGGLRLYFKKEDFTEYEIVNVPIWEFAKIKTVGADTAELLIKLQEKLKGIR